jgi:hypothetical protein
MTLSLHKDLGASGWHSSIVTTYSVDPSFFDGYVERRLRTSGVTNNILMADGRMLQAALNVFPEAFAGAGSRYAVLPVRVAGAFHPKLHLRIGEKKSSLIIGSANATAAGWGRNQEVVARLDWSLTKMGTRDNDVQGRLIAKVFAYVKNWLSESPGETFRHKLKLISQQSPWLDDLEPARDALHLEDGTSVDIFCESGGDTPTILEKFVGLVTEAKVIRLFIVSPYWDTDLRGFHELRAALGWPETFIGLSPQHNSFPVSALRISDHVQFVRLNQTGKGKFVHAKVFIAQTQSGDHILFGSANCSDDALGHLAGVSRNAELSVYRRLAAGSAFEILGIDLANVISLGEIAQQELVPSTHDDEDARRSAGVVELHGRRLVWWPPASEIGNGASVQIAKMSFPFVDGRGGKWRTDYTGSHAYPLIAKIVYADGIESVAVIVHAEGLLRKAAPGKIDPRLVDALNNMYGGDGDLMGLAAQASLIFEVPTQSSGGGADATRISSDLPAKTIKYETSGAFRDAILHGTGKTGRISDIGATFCDLFCVIASGVEAGLQTQSEDADQDDALLAGESDEELDDRSDAAEQESEGITPATPNRNKALKRSQDASRLEIAFTPEQIVSRRKLLAKALDHFEQMLLTAKKDATLSMARLPVQTVFMFRLMQYGVGHPHLLEDGSDVRLLDRSRCGLGRNGDGTFSVQAARILRYIWSGPDYLALRVPPPSTEYEIPDDITEFIVVSRWALGRAYLDSKLADQSGEHFKQSQLTRYFSSSSEAIYEATLKLGPIETIEEKELVVKYDARLGCRATETEGLLDFLANLTE